VGSGSEELNGTYDMMGNNWEWMESPWSDPSYGAGSSRGVRGGNWTNWSITEDNNCLAATCRYDDDPTDEYTSMGFRVASVPEPGSITLLVCGLLGLLGWGWRGRR